MDVATTNKQINEFMNALWKSIKTTDIPTQNDNEAWDAVLDTFGQLTQEHQGKAAVDRLFRAWVVDYLDYMKDVSKGMPSLMEEAKEVMKSV